MNVNRWHLKRLEFLLQKRLDESDLHIPIEVLAEELAGAAIFRFRTSVLGQHRTEGLELDVPDGPWQGIKAWLGLPFRRKYIYVSVYQIFPDLVAPKDQNSVVYVESEDSNV